MFVRICPPNRAPIDFEVKGNLSYMTAEIENVIKNRICDKTGIPPDEQNATYSPLAKGMKNIRKLALPDGIALTPEYFSSDLEARFSDTYRMSIIEVGNVGDWADADLNIPSNGMRIVSEDIADAGDFLEGLYHDLNMSRPIDVSKLDRFPDLRDASVQVEDVKEFFETTDESASAIATTKELACYDYVYRNIWDGLKRIELQKHKGSSQHSELFGSMMMHTPFLFDHHASLEMLELKTDFATELRLFLRPIGRTDIYRYTPRSDQCVVDNLSGLPVLICEVDSHNGGRDERRMLLQGAVACRLWLLGLPEPLKEKNRLLGMFVQDDFTVRLSLFHADSNSEVTVYSEQLVLNQEIDALRLVRILFNYRDGLMDIAGQFDQRQANTIQSLFEHTGSLPSLTSAKRNSDKKSQKSGKKSSAKPNLHQVQEEAAETLLQSCEVKSLFCQEGTSLQMTQHKHVVAVRMCRPPFRTLGFVKVTNKHELSAFDAIRNAGCSGLLDCIVLPTKVAEISGHLVAFLPYGGKPLSDYDGWGPQRGPLSGHEAKLALDLLRIIARLHEIGIAHLDIKPTNILWDASTRSIRIIDFDSSVIVNAYGSRKIKGVLGTCGYIAPEVEGGEDLEYDPFLADAFSCGRVIFDAIVGRELSEGARFVREMSEFLIEEDVGKRWSVNKVLGVWADRTKEQLGDLQRSKNDDLLGDRGGCRLSDGLKPMAVLCVN